MSRIAKYPVVIPQGVEVVLDGGCVCVKGPLGTLELFLHPSVVVCHTDDGLVCSPVLGAEDGAAQAGTSRALLANMVTGVTIGFQKKLNLVGVGYRAQAQGSKLNLSLGFSHPVVHAMPEGVSVETPTQTEVIIRGINKQLVGQIAAEVRGYRPPEPYKGKGVRYADELVILKEAKKK